nr:uncharacterized protein LOC123755106 [Procambarus clarkii]
MKRSRWWERAVLAVWGLVTVVLTQSYAGNLMALLAVRHISQPIQSLQDILDVHSGMFLVLACGLALGLLVLGMELLYSLGASV